MKARVILFAYGLKANRCYNLVFMRKKHFSGLFERAVGPKIEYRTLLPIRYNSNILITLTSSQSLCVSPNLGYVLKGDDAPLMLCTISQFQLCQRFQNHFCKVQKILSKILKSMFQFILTRTSLLQAAKLSLKEFCDIPQD